MNTEQGKDSVTVHEELKFKIGGITLKANFTLTFTIAPADTGNPLTLDNTSFTGKVGVAGITPNVLGIKGGDGTGKIVAVDTTALPPGVTLDADGNITGTPTQDGTFTVGISVADSQG